MRHLIVSLLVLLVLPACKQEQKNTLEMEAKSTKSVVVENIMNRRSVRSYQKEQIKDEELDQIITCAINAPSALNKQSWEIRVIQNPEILKNINDGFIAYAKDKKLAGSASRAQESGFSVFHGAPTLIIVANDQNNAYSQVDCGLLGQNILLSAESMDIGTCVVGSAIAFLNTPEAKSIIKQLNFPEGYKPLYTIAVGYKNERPEAKPRIQEKVQIIK